jgi:hypothetical protein
MAGTGNGEEETWRAVGGEGGRGEGSPVLLGSMRQGRPRELRGEQEGLPELLVGVSQTKFALREFPKLGDTIPRRVGGSHFRGPFVAVDKISNFVAEKRAVTPFGGAPRAPSGLRLNSEGLG